MSNKMELSYFLLVPNLLIRQINIPPYFINTNCSRDSGFTPASQAGFEISHVTPAKTNNNKYNYFQDIAPCTGCYINVLTQWQNCTQTVHSHTHTQLCLFLPSLRAHLRQKMGSIIMSCHTFCHPAQKHHGILFLCRICNFSCVTWRLSSHCHGHSRMHTNTGNKFAVTKRNSSLSSLYLWERREKRKGIVFPPLWRTSSLPLLMSSLLVAGRSICGVQRIYLLIQICLRPTLGL